MNTIISLKFQEKKNTEIVKEIKLDVIKLLRETSHSPSDDVNESP